MPLDTTILTGISLWIKYVNWHAGTTDALAQPQKAYSPFQLGLANLPGLPAAETMTAVRHYRDALSQEHDQGNPNTTQEYTDALEALYPDEGPTIACIPAFIHEKGYQLHGKHHEIYLGAPQYDSGTLENSDPPALHLNQ